jgi:uncharacterized SAM-binding protein YcdF (DUF218 family)
MIDLLRLMLQPFTLLRLLTGLGLLLLWRQRERPRRLWWVTAPYLLLTVVATPAMGLLALATLERGHPPALDRPADVQAIVVLGSTVAHHDPVLSRSQLDGPSLDRTWQAYRLYRLRAPRPVVVSGGKPSPGEPGPPCAELMAAELRRLGVPDRDVLVEGASRNTYENAVESARLLREQGLTHIVLVSDAHHLPRAAACFRAQGLEVVPSGCRHRFANWHASPADFVPSLGGLSAFHEAAHEWAALAVYWARGRT